MNTKVTAPTFVRAKDTPRFQVKDDVSSKVSPALHPHNVEAIEGYDDETASCVAPALNAFRTAYQGLQDIHITRDTANNDRSMTDAGRLLKVADFADKHMTRMTKAFDAAHANLTKRVAGVEAELTTPLEHAAARGPLGAEIRAHVKNLSYDERIAFMDKARADGDVATLAAVLGAPGYLSGIKDEMRDVWTRMYHEQNNPAKTRELKMMRAALEMIENRGGLVIGEIEKSIGASFSHVQKLREARTEAEKAFIMRDVENAS